MHNLLIDIIFEIMKRTNIPALKVSSFIIALLFSISCVYAQHPFKSTVTKRSVNIVFIGNSITYGAGLGSPDVEAPPAVACAYLRKQSNIINVDFSNQGKSGYTTYDFLPSTQSFADVLNAARSFKDKKALLIFSIKLGTNDSAVEGPNGAPVTPAKYDQNLTLIISKLIHEFPDALIILNSPIWYSPNTYNGAKYLQEGLTRLQSYIPHIQTLVNGYRVSSPGHVYMGDKGAFNYFKTNYLTDLQPENGKQGIFYLHPNKKGAAALGLFWGKAINNVIKEAY